MVPSIDEGSLSAAGGVYDVLNITGPTVVKASAGRAVRVSVVTAGSSASTVNDAASTAAATTADAVLSLPSGATGVFELDWPCQAGITVIPGTGAVLAVSFV